MKCMNTFFSYKENIVERLDPIRLNQVAQKGATNVEVMQSEAISLCSKVRRAHLIHPWETAQRFFGKRYNQLPCSASHENATKCQHRTKRRIDTWKNFACDIKQNKTLRKPEQLSSKNIKFLPFLFYSTDFRFSLLLMLLFLL